MAGLQYFDITVPANGSRNIGAEGTYFRYDTGTAGGADEAILVKADTGALATILRPGQSIKLPEKVREWRISNYRNTATITGIVTVGDGEINDSTVAGTVSVVDGSLITTMSGGAFGGFADQAATAANYSHVQLWNPAGNTKKIIVSQVIPSMNLAGAINLRTTNAALSTLQMNGANKRAGQPQSMGELRAQANAAILGSALDGFYIAGYSPAIMKFSEPVILDPGTGLLAVNITVNTQIAASFEWKEV